jgi:RNA polymerase sigma-70 factor (ECF subfamily)
MYAARRPDQREPVSDVLSGESGKSSETYGVVRCLVADDGHGRPRAAPELIDQHRANERFVRETEPVHDYLVRNANRLTRQRADAEDLVQETLLKAYSSFGGYREGTHVKSWLCRIMTNAWIDRHRWAQRRPPEQLSADVLDPPSDPGGCHRGRVDSAEAEALGAMPSDAELALRCLPNDLREVVYYACIADYRNTEIAAMLDIPVGTVGSKLHRGKALLRDALSDSSGRRQSARE